LKASRAWVTGCGSIAITLPAARYGVPAPWLGADIGADIDEHAADRRMRAAEEI